MNIPKGLAISGEKKPGEPRNEISEEVQKDPLGFHRLSVKKFFGVREGSTRQFPHHATYGGRLKSSGKTEKGHYGLRR